MPVDNHLYDRMAATWWDEEGFLHVLQGLNVPRLAYMERVLVSGLRLDLRGLAVLDIGCGGGLMAEEFARRGCQVTGVDPSARSIEAARAHASAAGLPIDYYQARGEALPFSDASFDVVTCCDVLEHVDDVGRVIAETARVLKPGGVYLYDTINRTFKSWLVMIKLFQDWRWTSFMPPRLHDWRMFITPDELRAAMVRSGLEPRGQRGLSPRAGRWQTLRLLRARKRGRLTYVELIERLGLAESEDDSVMYIGWAVQPSTALAEEIAA